MKSTVRAIVMTFVAVAVAAAGHAGSATAPASRPAATQPAATQPASRPTTVTTTSDAAGTTMSFGDPMTLAADDTMSFGEVLAKAADYDGKLIRVEGTVAQVCASRGCWLALGDDELDDTLFVKFTCPIEGRLIPTEAKGREAVVEGTLEIREIDEETARHIAEESGKSAAEIAAIDGPQRQLNMKSASAMVRGLPASVATP